VKIIFFAKLAERLLHGFQRGACVKVKLNSKNNVCVVFMGLGESI
jgi:hypothetical protein